MFLPETAVLSELFVNRPHKIEIAFKIIQKVIYAVYKKGKNVNDLSFEWH